MMLDGETLQNGLLVAGLVLASVAVIGGLSWRAKRRDAIERRDRDLERLRRDGT